LRSAKARASGLIVVGEVTRWPILVECRLR
jgi:hypothetical protein